MIPKVSVIVPIFNVEKYIERCAHSLFQQTLKELEYIFIDDCSPDNSVNKLLCVLNSYPERKQWTKIIRMPTNSGLYSVRKRGVHEATGEYIIHCDSDDWVSLDMYKKMYDFSKANDFDVVWCDYFRSDGINHELIRQKCDPEKNKLIKSFLTSKLIASLCNRMYRKSLHVCSGFVNPMANMTEDFVVTLQLIINAKNIGYLSEPLYYYFYNPQSLCMTIDENKIISNFKGLLQNSSIIFSLLNKAGLNNSLQQEIICKKCFDKDFLFMLLHKKKYRKLWLETYSEVNHLYLSNPYLRIPSKFRAFCIIYSLYPVYSFLRLILKGHA